MRGQWRGLGLKDLGSLLTPLPLARSFTHFLTGVCAIIGGMFTGEKPETSCLILGAGETLECRLEEG